MLPQLKLDAVAVAELLTGFIAQEIGKIGLSRAVIGLSGGVDSALSAALSVRALGAENVHCVMMPYSGSSPDSIAHAELLISQLGVRSERVDITPLVDPLIALEPEMDRVRRGNIMARARMIVLYDRSSRERALVVGTGNKTEMMLGYSTLFGDSACAINPLGDLYKTQVWQLSEYLDIPDVIIRKAPSADLWAGQTDEAELGFTYERIDELLVQMVDERQTDTQLAARGFDAAFISSIRNLIRRNQFKRMPPVIAKVGFRTVNADFRYPRDWGV
ncbi:MAG: NAD+ synthase [Bacteroidetes bacterium]|nr:NAD+ synthase [Bacteroidota bacterium]